jgi:hypothetical protein
MTSRDRGILVSKELTRLDLKQHASMPMYRSKLSSSLSSSSLPVNEWTIPLENLCLFYLNIFVNSPSVPLEWKYMGSPNF